MKYQAFLPHFGSMGRWFEGSWGGWVGVGVGGVLVRGGGVVGNGWVGNVVGVNGVVVCEGWVGVR